jgi:hypothetical protein
MNLVTFFLCDNCQAVFGPTKKKQKFNHLSLVQNHNTTTAAVATVMTTTTNTIITTTRFNNVEDKLPQFKICIS